MRPYNYDDKYDREWVQGHAKDAEYPVDPRHSPDQMVFDDREVPITRGREPEIRVDDEDSRRRDDSEDDE